MVAPLRMPPNAHTVPNTGNAAEHPCAFLPCTLALACAFIGYWLLNYTAFPLFDVVYHWTREASAIVGGLVLTGVAFASYWRPQWFSSKRFFVAAFASMVLGSGTMALGIFASDPVTLVCGAGLVTIGAGLANIIVGIGCIGMNMRQLGISVSAAYVLAYACRWIFSLLPGDMNLMLFCLAPLAALVLTVKYARPVLDQVYVEGTPAQAALTTPSSFLPFGHQLFITLLLFRFIYGCTLTFAEEGRVPLLAMGALVPLVLALVFVVCTRRDFSPDAFFQLSILCSVAGFLVLSVAGISGLATSTLLSCGTGFFEILMYVVLIALGARNTVSALPVLAWGNAMASWGTLLGANFGRLINSVAADPVMTSAATSAIVFGIVAYVVLVQKHFSFSLTIQGLTPLQPLVSQVDAPVSHDERCRVIGTSANLTEREQEIFEYLARGRNVRFIQDELTVSYNTVKTHVSHIYAKLNVHSHQELINLVESTTLDSKVSPGESSAK